MPDSFTFWLIVLAVLIVYLNVSLGVHAYKRARRECPREREFEGQAFRASTIAPRIKQVRQNHLATVQVRPNDALNYRSELVGTARRMMTRLYYFRCKGSEDEAEKPDA